MQVRVDRFTAFRLLLFLAVVVLISTSAIADTISFAPPAGPYPSAAQGFTGAQGEVVTANGWYYTGTQVATGSLSGGSWSQTGVRLFGRNDVPTDIGLGICSPNEVANCGTGTGYGDFNEISNEKNSEVLILTRPAGWQWSSVTLSSLDNNGSTPLERGVLYALNAPFTSSNGSNLGTAVCDFVAGGGTGSTGTGVPFCFGPPVNTNPSITIPSMYANSNYLVFQAFDWTGGGNTNNDFLVNAAVVTQTPEPSSIVLCVTGLVGTLRLRKKLRN